jgi:uncharacterized protein
MSAINHLGKVVIAGGSGFLGVSLANHLASLGAEVVILSRTKPKGAAAGKHVAWDARTVGDWVKELDGASALVNLVGRTVDCIKTPDHCDEILRSRVESTQVLGKALRAVAEPPPVWVQMSTAHIYGDPPSLVCTEDSAFGVGLAPLVGRAWEDAHNASRLPSQKSVVLRTGFVLGCDQGAGGGAFARLKFLTRIGLGGRIGSGKQGMSWLHEADFNRTVERAIRDEAMQGAYIVSSPNPVSQAEFAKELRRAIGMPIGLPATEWMVRIGAPLLLHTDHELAIYGRYVLPKRLLDEGFEFRFPMLADALREIVRPASMASQAA